MDQSAVLRPFRKLLGRRRRADASDYIRRQSRLGLIFWLAATFIIAAAAAALFANFLPLQNPSVQNYRAINAPFSLDHLFGTDYLGRDMFSRTIYGARISFGVGFSAPLIGIVIGLCLGMSAGYFRGRVDSAVGILVDSILAFPNIVLAIGYLFFAGPTLINVILVISFYTIPHFTRISRANTILYAQREFVLAARAQGASNLRILLRELLPNVIVPVASYSLLVMSFTIVLEGTLSFLGVGIPPPTPTWGRMIAEGVEELAENPWISFVPSIFMFLTVLSLNLMGDRLRQLSDVRSSNA